MEHLIIITTREFGQLFNDCKSKIEIPNIEKFYNTIYTHKDINKIKTILSHFDYNKISNSDLKIDFLKAVVDHDNKVIEDSELIDIIVSNKEKLPSVFFDISSSIKDLDINHRFYHRKFISQVKVDNQPIEVYGYRCFEERDDILGNKKDFLSALITDIAVSKKLEVDEFFSNYRVSLIVHGDDIGYKPEKDTNDKYLLERLKDSNSTISAFFKKTIPIEVHNKQVEQKKQHSIHPYSHQAGVFLDIIKSKKYEINSAEDIYNIIHNHQEMEKTIKEHEEEIFKKLEFSEFNFKTLKSKLF